MVQFRRACLTLIVCLPALSWAQQNPAPPAANEQPQVASPSSPQPSPAAPAATEGRIHLDVVVTDKSGKPVSGLDLKDFTLLDNNQPAKILSFHAFDGTVQKAEPPVEVILLLDTVNLPIQEVSNNRQRTDSGLMSQQTPGGLSFQAVSIARQHIANFLIQNGGHLAQPVSLFVLTSQGLDLQRQPLLDGNELAAEASQRDNKLRALTASAGRQGAVENYQFSVQMMKVIAREEAKKPGRKLLIWTGPGWPLVDSSFWGLTNADQKTLFDTIAQLSTRLREARISIYNVSSGTDMASGAYEGFLKGVKTAEKANSANLALKVLAVQTGGGIFGPDNDLTAQINRCVQNASTYYTLSFDPPPAAHANEYHDLKVTVGQTKLTARTTTGYYNQP
jgi:VWFA-related protein